MIVQRIIWGFAMIWLLAPLQAVRADQCDDVHEKADALHDSAREALKQRNYDQAAELYNEAAQYYDQLGQMRNCR